MNIAYKLLILLTLLIISFNLSSQISKKKLQIVKTDKAPDIDGRINEATWENAAVIADFVQYEPYNGEKSKQKTVVKILYDDTGIYFAAMMYASNTDSISRTLNSRDVGFDDNADFIAITIGPFNDGINMNMFLISAAGVQSDVKATSADDDFSWDAVWKSEVRIVDSGWIAEVKIPFSELRYSKEKEQVWGFNIYRKITQYNEWSSWSYVDNKIEGHSNQAGEISGLKDLKPTLRLSFTPYLSVLAEHNSETNVWTRGIRGGLDLKYGITESFTLDMMLIPDFAQIQTDDKVLNLSPFEIRYEERRPFFNEGTELFSKGEIFYSKRIGGFPINYWAMEDSLSENERLVENPSESQIINATKVTGRTKGGLGIGIFNTMTAKSIVRIKDTLSGMERNLVSQPFTNYNILVFDQSLKHNSHFSIINSNMVIPDNDYIANVSAIDFKLKNPRQTYQVQGVAGISQIYETALENEFGYSYDISLEKTSGAFQFELEQEFVDDKYNPNDMGYLSFNNYLENSIDFRHKIVKPYKKLISYNSNFSFNYINRYKPYDFMSIELNLESNFTFTNYFSCGFFAGGNPKPSNNYHEPRLDYRVFVEPKNIFTGLYCETDSRKKFFSNFVYFHWLSFSQYDQSMNHFEINPTWRASDRFILSLNSEYEEISNSLGYVSDNGTDAFFGKRKRLTFSNAINAEYSFNEKIQLTFRMRHYMSSAKYDQYYILNHDGTLNSYPGYTENENITYNAFNIDMVFNWRFAPGSDILLVWKNAINSEYEEIRYGYLNNLDLTFDSPKYNHFSIKVVYYLDYNYFRRKTTKP